MVKKTNLVYVTIGGIVFAAFFLSASLLTKALSIFGTESKDPITTLQKFLEKNFGEGVKYSIVKKAEKNGYYVFSIDPTREGEKEFPPTQKSSCDYNTGSACINVIVYDNKIFFSHIPKKDSKHGLGSFYKFTNSGVVFFTSKVRSTKKEKGNAMYFTYLNLPTKKLFYSQLTEKSVKKVKKDSCGEIKTFWTKTTTFQFFDSPEIETRKPLAINAKNTEEAFYKREKAKK